MERNKNIAIILAGGIGSRLGLDKPKQFLKVAGKTVLEHTVDVFQKHEKIDEIAIVMHGNYLDIAEQMVATNHWTKVKRFLMAAVSVMNLVYLLFVPMKICKKKLAICS